MKNIRSSAVAMIGLLTRRSVTTFAFQQLRWHATVLGSTRLCSTFDDTYGRRIRRRPIKNEPPNNDDWGVSEGWKDDDDDADDWGAPTRISRKTVKGGWDDSDDNFNEPLRQRPRPKKTDSRPRGRSFDRSPRQQHDFGSRNSFPQKRNKQTELSRNKSRPIDMNALEGAGFVHLYGLSSVLNALQANRRDMITSKEEQSKWMEEEEKYEEPPKPQAQFRPYLFVQERKGTTRTGQKASTAEKVIELAQERNVPIAEVDKGVLNTLSGNRPHQGFVLRCGKLYFESMSRIPLPADNVPSVWLVLDEVVDPQNLGALLRSAFFLGRHNLGVLVCAKNSAPPTPVVSAASAGALELLTVYSTTNLPRTLNNAQDDGFRIIGASSSMPSINTAEEDVPSLYDLHDLPVDDDRPTLLVLGSEGHGLRTLVAKACSEFVRIPPGTIDDDSEEEDGVDSLNVSVTGGILLWHLLGGAKH